MLQIAKKKAKRLKKTKPETVRRLVVSDPIDEIAPQAKELLDRILELRTLTPVLSDAKKLAAETESRMRVLQQEKDDILNGLLPGMPPEPAPQFPPMVPVPESGPRGYRVAVSPAETPEGVPEDAWDAPEPEPDDDTPAAESYNEPLRDRDELSAKTVASCNNAQLLTVGKVVEWWASRVPFSSIPGVGSAEDRELRALVSPYRSMWPKRRATLGM